MDPQFKTRMVMTRMSRLDSSRQLDSWTVGQFKTRMVMTRMSRLDPLENECRARQGDDPIVGPG